MKSIRIGARAGYSGDRIEPAVELAQSGALDYLVFECLAERTIALAQQVRLKDPSAGYDPLLAARMRAVLPVCANKVKIVTNMGAANPAAAAGATRDIARKLGLKGLKVAAVTGDDVFAYLHDHDVALDNEKTIAAMGDSVISANAYVGAAAIADALRGGADVVITGRAADPAIFMAPLIAEFGWAVRSDLLDTNLGEVCDHVRLEIGLGVVDLVEQLLLDGPRRHGAARARDLRDDDLAVLADLADREAEPARSAIFLTPGSAK